MMTFPSSGSAFPDMRHILKNDFSEIPPATEEVDRFLIEQGASADVQYVARLVIEELVTNIIKYGYDDNSAHDIQIEARLEDDKLVMEISDDGHPFDPWNAPAPDLSLPADQRPIGGLGLHLVRNMSDSFAYERHDDKNIVTISKNLVSPSSG